MIFENSALGRIDCLSKLVRGACYILAAFIVVLQFAGSGMQPLFMNADMSIQYMSMPEAMMGQTESSAVTVLTPTWPFVALSIITSVLFLFALYQLERLFASYQKQIFYVGKNNQRLRNIGLALVGIALLQPLQQVFMYFMTRDIAIPEALKDYTVELALTLDFPLLIIGLVFICIASILAGALRLQEEADLTI